MQHKIKKIKNDASFREFSRLINKKKSSIIVTAKKQKYKNLIAYEAVNKFLRKNKILAPKLISHNYKKGIIIIEDFGNISFRKILLKNKNQFKLYKQLINLLLRIQKIKPKTRISSTINKSYYIKKYSNQHLIKESNLFFDWYLPLIYKEKKVLDIKKKIKSILIKTYKKLYFSNKYFVHRDFHSENLMKVGKKVGVIDSQDALIGNPAYDLVSLIDDVRIKTKKNLKDKVYIYYLKRTFTNHQLNKKHFLNDFNILSVQRNLKIIGIFSRLYKRDKKGQYLKLIPYAWKLLESRMKSKLFDKLKKSLDFYISQKNRKRILFK